jgi:beta-lactam-binding protein with PASTA domain
MRMKRLFASKLNLFLLSLAISLSIQLGFSLHQNFQLERPIAVIDFTFMSAEEVLAWAQDQQLQVVFDEVFDDDVDLGQVITQSTLVGERLFAGSRVRVTLSKGPDPEVLVDLIDFSALDIGDVQLFIERNRLLNASLSFEKSESVASAFVIRSEPSLAQIRRGDAVRFFISTGDKDQLTTVRVPDFTEYSRPQISTWANSANIKVNFIEEFNPNVALGRVITQSQAANSEIYDGSSLSVRVSLGAGVVLDNLVGKSQSAIDQFINSNNLRVNYSFTYSSAQNKDFGISMNPRANTRVAEGSTVEVSISLGRISLNNFTGKRLSELEAWVSQVNQQGGNLRINSTITYSDNVATGLLISQSPSSGDLNPGSEIRVSVSKGEGVVVRNFVGTSTFTQENLRITRSDTYHASVPAGQVISQSIAAGTQVDLHTSVSLVVSLGRINVSNFTNGSLSALQAWVNAENAKGANLSISSSTSFNALASGNVISQSPSSGTIAPGSSITVSVSRGPGVTVNNFVGGTTVSQSGLRVSTSTTFSETVASGRVISQSISAGTVVDTDTAISLVVSAGPEPRITIADLAGIVAGQSTSVTRSRELITSYLNSLGATNFSFTVGSFGIGAGQVNSQSPAGGTSIRRNDPIVVALSDN